MLHPGTLTDIEGIKVGHYTDQTARTGCTVVLCEGGFIAGVDVRGAAPGTRETDLLSGYHLVEKINALVLSGGSAFGLAAADGVMEYLSARGVGFDSGAAPVPIVPAAVLFDLGVGDALTRPDKKSGMAACEAASAAPVAQGAVGAGTGATVGKLLGMESSQRGGIGSATVELPGGLKVSALIAVNALGDVVDHETGEILAGLCQGGKHQNTVKTMLKTPGSPQPGGNTTIGVVATNAALPREETHRLATMGHDGYAMAIRPVHTPFDGDTVFGLSSGKVKLSGPAELAVLFAAAAEAVALAIENAVRA